MLSKRWRKRRRFVTFGSGDASHDVWGITGDDDRAAHIRRRFFPAVAKMRYALHSATLVTLALLALEDAAAQSVRRSTVGRLLGGLVDTIEAKDRLGGELGSRGASLRLVRVDSGYSGTLRMQVFVNRGRRPVMAGSPSDPNRQCDTTVTATMTPSAARSLLALVRTAVIEPGEAPEGPIVYDAWHEYSYRLTSGSNAVVVRSARTVVHGESRYRAPLRRGRRDPTQPPWAALDLNSSLMKVHGMLQPYMQEDRLIAFSRACHGE